MKIKSLAQLDSAIHKCTLCPRLVEWREEVAITKRRSYQAEKYWGKPVSGFGPVDASLLILGLAPGAHGANRTGRVFTGDSSGDWLYRALHKVGLAKLPTSISKDDGQELYKTRIFCAVRCAPPDNKPTNEERNTCSPFFARELELLMPTAQSILVLGNFAWTALFAQLAAMDFAIPKPRPKFGHGEIVKVKDLSGKEIMIVGSYHPSQQNTFTGKLTEKMLDQVIKKVI
jgi:uracil-DNA glycosylase family 4